MSNKFIFVQVFVVVLTATFTTQFAYQGKVSGQKTTTANVGAVEANVPADVASIQIAAPDYEIIETNLDYLQSLPMPKVKFVFENKNEFSAVPVGIEEIMNAHWKAAIKFFYERRMNKAKTAQEAVDRDTAWTKFCLKTSDRLQDSFVNAPNGSRKISRREAAGIFGGLNRAAVDLLDKADVIK